MSLAERGLRGRAALLHFASEGQMTAMSTLWHAPTTPQGVVGTLARQHKLKLKGAGPAERHLGMAFCCNERGASARHPRGAPTRRSAAASACLEPCPPRPSRGSLPQGANERLALGGLLLAEELGRISLRMASMLKRRASAAITTTLPSFHVCSLTRATLAA